MQVYSRESSRLKSAEALVRENFPRFGVNKKQEITRLLYEISKREGILPVEILGPQDLSASYPWIKKTLLQRRYPLTYQDQPSLKTYLPKLRFQAYPLNSTLAKNKKFYPKKVFIEKSVISSALAARFKGFFPKADFEEIGSFKEYRAQNKDSGIADYNKRQETVFIVRENYDFFKKCPCTKCASACGYHIFNLGFGCIYECVYCYLQEYTNTPGIILPANIGDFFNAFNAYKKEGMRIGSGEFTDSLALDSWTGYSLELIDFFNKHPQVTFEFKTKSIEIDNLLRTKHAGNIVVSWSLNPQRVIDENEFFSSSLEERLAAAKRCVARGYKVGFHFDPIIYFSGWQDEYARLMESLFAGIKPKDIAWISLGTLRFRPELKTVIESRFPNNKILDEELLLGYDNKLRYSDKIRYSVYSYMISAIRGYSNDIELYLCMEDKNMRLDFNL
ncbi:MAG: spore photoproduct lyase family protein [Candidatus Omnitrophota bacterium]